MAKKKIKSISVVDLPDFDVPVSGSMILGSDFSTLAPPSGGSPQFSFGSFAPALHGVVSLPSLSRDSGLFSVSPVLSSGVSLPGQSTGFGLSPPVTLQALQEGSPVTPQAFSSPVAVAPVLSGGPQPPVLSGGPQAPVLSGGSQPLQTGYTSAEVKAPEVRNYAALLKSSAQLQQLGTPVEHVSGAPFVLIPDENIEAAKIEFKDFIYARFHGDYPSMGKIIGIVNAVWAKTGPRIFVHNLGHGTYLLRVTSPRTREVLLSRTCWNIGGLPMFIAPWAPDYSPEEPPLTDAIVPVEMRNVPYLLFNKESLSRIATAVGKPESLAPETERKENFEVAKLFVRVDLTAPLPNKIISGFSNGREVVIDVSYPWLPVQCELCKKYGHKSSKCTDGVLVRDVHQEGPRIHPSENARRRSKSRPGRSTEKKVKQGQLRYVPVNHSSPEVYVDADSDVVPVVNTVVTLAQEDTSAELEEGEICQVTMEKSSVLQAPTGENNNILASEKELQVILDAQPVVVPINEMIIAAITDAITTAFNQEEAQYSLDGGSVPDEVELLPDPTGAILPPVSAGVVPNESAEASESPRDDGFQVITETAMVTETVTVAQEGVISEEPLYPAEVEERENPFILVNNRKSSRKAAKRH